MTTALHAAGMADEHSKILGGFRGKIQPVPVSPLYLGALAIVAMAMVLLPLVYVALISGAAYGVFWYALNGWRLLEGISSLKVRGLVFVTPLLTGAILVLFMVKPLFARRVESQEPRRLSPEEEPLLFAFVQRVCETVGAPRPREIHIDGRVNASASFRRGFLSLFTGDLVLTLGLPLVAGFSLPQLAGVLAHEFGHFGQRAALRLSFVVRSVNAWFARVVYERDEWDEQLLAYAKESDFRLQIVLWCAIGFVWVTRKILWLLMMVGHVISSFLLRQMEFDADRYEARLVGRDVARSTFGELFGLSLAHQRTWMSLGGLWQEGRLGDRFAGLVAASHRQLLTQAPRVYQEHLAQTKTGLLDTHPSDRERIASIEREAETGVFACDLPATALFADFEALERAFTADLYRLVFGARFTEGSLVSVDEAVAAQRQASEDEETVQRHLERDPGALWPFQLPVPPFTPPTDPAAALHTLREAMAAQRAAYAHDVRAYEEVTGRLRQTAVAEAAVRAGFQIKPESFGLPGGGLDDITRASGQARGERAAIEARLHAFEDAPARRLLTALALQEPPGTAQPKLACLLLLNENHARLVELMESTGLLGVLDRWSAQGGGLQTVTRMREEADRIGSLLQALAGSLAGHLYPFDDRAPGLTLTALAQLEAPVGKEIADIHHAAERVHLNLQALYTRLLADLASTAESVEETLGFAPLPPPEAAA